MLTAALGAYALVATAFALGLWSMLHSTQAEADMWHEMWRARSRSMDRLAAALDDEDDAGPA